MRMLHTMIRVNDLDESLRFYCEQLGMKLLRKHEFPGGRFTSRSSASFRHVRRIDTGRGGIGSTTCRRRARSLA